MKMKSSILLFAAFMSVSSLAYSSNFPTGPNPQLTPGKLCDRPTTYRYPEHIAYCDRDVSYDSKELIIARYDQQLGYHINSLNRGDFKIDHYIPLCAGGSNDITNLWPQHKSIYNITDPVEPLVCEKMLAGKLRQADAIKLITRAKNYLSQVAEVMRILKSL